VLNDKHVDAKEDIMEPPDLDTLACVNPECQLLRYLGARHLVIRKVSGCNDIRPLRCHACGEKYSE
jgi:hypothetical protein